MERLGARDLRGLLSFLGDIYHAPTPGSFLSRVVSRFPALIAADSVSYNEVNLRLQRNTVLVDPPDAFVFPDHRRVFERHIPEHPLVTHYRRTGDVRALKISDFLSRSQFHRLGIYNEFFRRVNVEDLLAVTLRIRPSLVTGIALTRSRRDFSERDRLCLDLLRPHLIRAYDRVETTARIQRDLDLARHELDVVGYGVILLTTGGRIRALTARARQQLAEFFGCGSRLAHTLPEDLRRWLSHQKALLARRDDVPEAREPLVMDRPGKRLIVRLCGEDSQSLLLEEPTTGLRPQVLEQLGISRREAEVLAWMAEGKTNKEIGAILGASPRTVGKHLERIFERLGVETRTAAAARAFQVAGVR